jgi:hypothetical protein
VENTFAAACRERWVWSYIDGPRGIDKSGKVRRDERALNLHQTDSGGTERVKEVPDYSDGRNQKL